MVPNKIYIPVVHFKHLEICLKILKHSKLNFQFQNCVHLFDIFLIDELIDTFQTFANFFVRFKLIFNRGHRLCCCISTCFLLIFNTYEWCGNFEY